MATSDRRARGGARATKVWAGRLSGPTSERVEAYTSSLAVDGRLGADDVAGSRAHARMLRSIGVLSAAQHRAIDTGLRAIAAELSSDAFAVSPGDEDIHTAVERRLFELAGPVAGMLHTGRSRNDQVATDLRMWARRACTDLLVALAGLQEALASRAVEHRTAPMPGYTHLQRAQVVSLAHHLLAYVEMFARDALRLAAARRACDELPLGSGALAGSTLPLDRDRVAGELGFGRLAANSMDAVADRDFAVDIASACALTMVHCSRLGEELVLWSSVEFGFVSLPDSHATGSSLMPQKKNADVAELARGRSGRVIGDVVALLTVLKGLPLTYNRDLQEDKEPLFDAVDTTASTLRLLTEVITVVHFDVEAMRRAASDPSLQATDIAEHLVANGVPFREAHTIVGEVVARTLAEGRTLGDLDVSEWRAASDRFDPGVVDLFDADAALRRRDVPGGPGPKSVTRQLARARALVARTRKAAAGG
ncbi:MAG: argininosuccinate lyase [Candidatus Dormibacteria bacterium]